MPNTSDEIKTKDFEFLTKTLPIVAGEVFSFEKTVDCLECEKEINVQVNISDEVKEIIGRFDYLLKNKLKEAEKRIDEIDANILTLGNLKNEKEISGIRFITANANSIKEKSKQIIRDVFLVEEK